MCMHTQSNDVWRRRKFRWAEEAQSFLLRYLHSYFSDLTELFEEDVKGPAKFTCETGSGCWFEEDEIDSTITTFFGDPYITLNCSSGECLAKSMLPGYEVRLFPRFLADFIDITCRGLQNQTILCM